MIFDFRPGDLVEVTSGRYAGRKGQITTSRHVQPNYYPVRLSDSRQTVRIPAAMLRKVLA